MTEHPDSNLIDIFALIFDDFKFRPTIHVYYESKTVSVNDGLPKFKDLPAEFNGSGETIPEWKNLKWLIKITFNKKTLFHAVYISFFKYWSKPKSILHPLVWPASNQSALI